jgi:hypothetical protein
MTVRAQRHLRRDAVERVRRRIPGLVPDSVEVVELARGEAYAVVRASSAEVLVLDRRGRLVRSPRRLSAVGRHLRAVGQVRGALAKAELVRRLGQAEASAELLRKLAPALSRDHAARLDGAIQALCAFQAALEAAILAEGRSRTAQPTVRTLHRLILLLNEAAAADRAVVRAVRALGAALAAEEPTPARDKALRFALARLATPDLPYFMRDLAAAEQEAYGAQFAQAVRRGPV